MHSRRRHQIAVCGLLLLVCAVAPGTCQDEPSWEVRRAQAMDQTDEWTAMGRVPGWDVSIADDDAGTIDISGDDDGRFRGLVLVGRRWTVPGPEIEGAVANVEYQTYCTMDSEKFPRAGIAYLAAMTPERWEKFATDPEKAEKWNVGEADPEILGVWNIHTAQQDVTEWRYWQSVDLLKPLNAHRGREVVLALVWGCKHFDPEWGRFRGFRIDTVTKEDRERQFFSELNLDRPDMSAVRAAVDAGDFAAARVALAEHFRTRETPVLPPVTPDGSPNGIRIADELLDHVFRLASCPPTRIEGPIRWNEDPHDYDQWAIALNRHTHWVTLGRAYLATQDEKYAREFVDQLNSWIDALPIYIGPRWIQGPMTQAGKSPLSLDAGIRMAQSWWQAYACFKDSPSFDPESQARMIRSFRDHAVYLMDPAVFHVTSNWGAMEVNGLFWLAVMLPEFRAAPVWLETARKRLVDALAAQVYPDGAQIELAPGYHGVTVGNFVGALEVGKRNGVDLPPEFVAGLERMYEYYVAIAGPDGRMPALNDSGWGGVSGMLNQGLQLFPHRSDFEYVISAGMKGAPPAQTSWRLPYAGWNMMRTGWRRDDRYLLFETGPFGAAHQHEDKLGIILHDAGRTILTEGGVYSYDRSEWRKYILSTRAHSTVMVDGLEQNRRRVPDTNTVWKPEDARWISDERLDFARGIYSEGYGPDNALRVTHRRQVAFVKPDYWLVHDTLTPEDDLEHTYEAIFHLDADEVVLDGSTARATHAAGGLDIVALGAPAPVPEIVQGQTDPVVQGWLPTGVHNVLRPIPTTIFRWKAKGPTQVAFLLVPTRPGQPAAAVPATVEVSAGALYVDIQRAGAFRDLFLLRAGPESADRAGRITSDADAAIVLLSGDGRAECVYQVGGGRVSLEDNSP